VNGDVRPPPSSVFSLNSTTRLPEVPVNITDMPPPAPRHPVVPHVDMDAVAEGVVARVMPALLIQHAETIQALCEARYKNEQLQLERELGERALAEQREDRARFFVGRSLARCCWVFSFFWFLTRSSMDRN
jgi:hypothetical protein